MALRVFLREKVSLSTLAFVLGLSLLALDCVFAAFSAASSNLDPALKYYRWRFLPLAFTPGIWLAFSVTYARGNYAAFWRRWLPVIVFLCVAVPAVAIFFQDELFEETASGLRLRTGGRIVHVFLVIGAT